MISCHICKEQFINNLGGQLTNHLESAHSLSYKDWVVATQYKGISPRCICGMCEEEPHFYRKDFRKYAFGHNNFEWRNKRYIEIYGPPKCKVCNVEVGFVRAKPMKYCSHVCSGKDVGFTNPKTKEAIKRVMQKKYGVNCVFQLPHIKERSREAVKNRVYIPSDETKKKIAKANKELWKSQEYRDKVLPKMREFWRSPEERKRRSIQQTKLMSNQEYVDKLMATGGMKGRLSKLHIKIRDLMKLDEKGFKSEQVIGSYCVDELNYEKKLIIEINGDYIHANPKKYKSEDIICFPGERYTAQEKWNKDQQRLEFLYSKGYKVYVIWESDNMDEWKQIIENFN